MDARCSKLFEGTSFIVIQFHRYVSLHTRPIMQPQKTPCFGQSPQEVEAWLRANVEIGATVAIRNTQAGLLHYLSAQVTRIAKGRLEVAPEESYGLSLGSHTFYYSGKNCRYPKGQTRLVIPTLKVRAAYGPPGTLGLSYGPFTV